jgi:hypothetical protein
MTTEEPPGQERQHQPESIVSDAGSRRRSSSALQAVPTEIGLSVIDLDLIREGVPRGGSEDGPHHTVLPYGPMLSQQVQSVSEQAAEMPASGAPRLGRKRRPGWAAPNASLALGRARARSPLATARRARPPGDSPGEAGARGRPPASAGPQPPLRAPAHRARSRSRAKTVLAREHEPRRYRPSRAPAAACAPSSPATLVASTLGSRARSALPASRPQHRDVERALQLEQSLRDRPGRGHAGEP